jgi:Flp pilus assembly protein TadG
MLGARNKRFASVSDHASNEAGSVALEFAFIAPILVVLTFGVVETTNLLAQDRKVALANQSMVDIVARLSTVTNADRTSIAQAVDLIMQPYASSYTATVAIVSFDKNGKTQFGVGTNSAQFNVKGNAPFTQAEMDQEATGLGIGSDEVVIGRITSNYSPMLLPWFLSSDLLLGATNTQRPRPQHIVSKVTS